VHGVLMPGRLRWYAMRREPVCCTEVSEQTVGPEQARLRIAHRGIPSEDSPGKPGIPEAEDGDIDERVTGLRIDKIEEGVHPLRDRVDEHVLRLQIRVDEGAGPGAEDGIERREMTLQALPVT